MISYVHLFVNTFFDFFSLNPSSKVNGIATKFFSNIMNNIYKKKNINRNITLKLTKTNTNLKLKKLFTYTLILQFFHKKKYIITPGDKE
jgi:hypothetical protein